MGPEAHRGDPCSRGLGGKQIALEALATVNPDRLLLMENSENKMVASKVWNNMNAVKNEKISNVDNYNYSYTAMGRMELMDRLGTMILEGQK